MSSSLSRLGSSVTTVVVMTSIASGMENNRYLIGINEWEFGPEGSVRPDCQREVVFRAF